ncbi:unnamed protein product [Durusdinium trenchii]|uniref:Integrase catalytic domain-containing protein n=1 Tax=Durusdinium trenchii TaxID=1381693 RepID=A0ABP0LGV0_9DINO
MPVASVFAGAAAPEFFPLDGSSEDDDGDGMEPSATTARPGEPYEVEEPELILLETDMDEQRVDAGSTPTGWRPSIPPGLPPRAKEPREAYSRRYANGDPPGHSGPYDASRRNTPGPVPPEPAHQPRSRVPPSDPRGRARPDTVLACLHCGKLHAESEHPTMDPVVEPGPTVDPVFEPDPSPARPIPSRSPTARATFVPPPEEAADKSEGDQVLDLLRKLVKKENGSGGTSSNASWNSLKGPVKGVRYRGGAPPAPPTWKYQANDVRAYERFERKVRLWELQARHWMSRAEAGLALYASLQGEAEQQLEFLDTDRVYSQEGVQYVLDELKAAFQQQAVYVKRHYLHDYEHIARYPQESLRSFVNRYKRCEAALLGIGVNVSLTYDEEARGSRLLDRCRLSSDQQRLILVGTSQKMSFSVVAQALTMQYPDYKPPPPVVQRDGAPKGTSKGRKGSFGTTSSSSTSPHTSTTASSATSYRKGDGKSRFGDGRPRRVFQTITEDQQAEDSSGNHDYINDDDEYLLPDSTDNQIEHAVLAAEHQPDDDEEAGDSAGELDELTRVLTVTAKKLASMNQGRKFRNAPKKSIEQRKQESPCAACGQLGHWAGDNACQVSSKGQKAGKGKGSPDKANKGFDGGKKVFTVNHYTGFDVGDEFGLEDHSPFSPHEVLVVFQNATHVNFKSSKAAHFMILDTACQKSCCGHEWYIEHQKILERNDLHAVLHPQSERFQFGAGEPLVSKTLALLPIGIDKRMCVFGVNILDASIPFLCSLNLMNQMGLQLDLANQTAIIGAFNNHKVPLTKVLGHLALCITDFSMDSHFSTFVHEQCSSCPPHKTEFISFDAPPQHQQMDQEDVSVKTQSSPRMHESPTHTDLSWASLVKRLLRLRKSVWVQMQAAMKIGIIGMNYISKAAASTEEPPKGRMTAVKSKAAKPKKTSQASSSQQPPPELELNLPPPKGQVRERLGQFRSMQGVLPTLEVERRRRRMEVGWLLLKSLAIAAVTLDGSGNSYHGLRGTLGPDGEPGHGLPSGTGATLRDLWSDWDGSAGAFATDSAQAQANIQSSINDIFSRGPWFDCRSTAGLRHLDEQQPEPRPRSEHLRVGVRKQLSGSINKNVKMLENEVYILNKLPNKETLGNKVDLMELYSGEARPKSLAPRYGLTSIQPFELQDGYDLDAPHVRGWVEEGQTRYKPLLLLLGPPCTNWCIFNENLNYKHRMDQLSALRAQERPRVKWSAERCLHQANRGDLFFFENPLKSRIWSEPAVQKLMNHPDTVKVTCDGGAFGAQDEDGYNIIKTYGILTNSKSIANRLARRMTKQEKTFCRPLESKHVTASQVYPIKMVHAILQGLREEARQRDPIRFEPPQMVFYARPIADEGRWREALDMVKKTFGTSANKSVQLNSTSAIYKIVADLVPWELTRVQIAATPAVRRMPTDVLYTHRGLAVVYNDSSIDVESEDLSMIEHPKQRFARPVAHGIFFYGNAEDEPKPVDEAAVPPERHIPGLRTDVNFPNLPPSIPREVQASVARLHINAGHPSRQEMIRLFTMHGAITAQVISCLDHLQCGTCKRTKTPQQPRPAAVPVLTGQFGDRLQMDRFWVRDLSGTNHCFLGVVDMATNYQQAIRLTGNGSNDVYEALRQLWLRPFGHPLMIEGDDDRNFGGVFKERLEANGTHLIIVPGEAHWRIGTIERKNAILRQVAERLIDERGACTGSDLDDIMIASLQDIQILKNGAQQLQQGLWGDERGPGPPADEPVLPEVAHEQAPELADLVMPIVPSAPTPAPAPATPALPTGSMLHEPTQPPAYSPTFKQKNIQINFGAQRTPHGMYEMSHPYAAPSGGNYDALPPEVPQPVLPATDVPVPPDTESVPALLPVPALGEERPVTDQLVTQDPPDVELTLEEQLHRDLNTGEALPKVPRTFASTLMTYADRGRPQQLTLPPDGWDGSPLLELPETSYVFREYVQGKDLRWTPTTVMWADGLTKSEVLGCFLYGWKNRNSQIGKKDSEKGDAEQMVIDHREHEANGSFARMRFPGSEEGEVDGGELCEGAAEANFGSVAPSC